MLTSLSNFLVRRAWWTLAAAGIFLTVAGFFGGGVFDKLSQGGFENDSADSTAVSRDLEQRFDGGDDGLLVLFSDAREGLPATDPQFAEAARAVLIKAAGQPGVEDITTYYDANAPPLLSRDGKQTYAVIALAGDEEQQTDTVERLRPLLRSDRLEVRLGGAAAAGEELNTQIDKDLAFAEKVSFPILLVLLLIVFRSFLAALLPLAIGVLSIIGAFLIIRILTTFMDVSVYAINIITLLGLGLAIDYSLFMVSRFREELRAHKGSVPKALAVTMATAGRTVLFSGIIVMVSLLSLTVFPLSFLQSMGLGGAAAVLVAMLAALTVLPAAMALLGRRVFPRRQRGAAVPVKNTIVNRGLWYRLSRFVMRYPITVLVTAGGLLLLAGTPFLRAEFSVADAGNLPPAADARQVSETLDRDFPGASTESIRIVVTTKHAPTDPRNVEGLYDYARQVQRLPGVTRVDGLISNNPSLDKAAHLAFYSDANQQNPAAQAAVGRFVGRSATVLEVSYAAEPMSAEARALVERIRDLPDYGLTAKVGGTTAELLDLLDTLRGYLPYALAIIALAMGLLLFLMLGSVVVPVQAILLNLVSLSATFGALVWVFQERHLDGLLGFNATGSIDATQPILIFAIAFGLSMDYTVFLLSRIKEQYDRTGKSVESIALGVERTGGIITSAAVLLVVVIGAFATGEISLMQQIGFGLALAILIDAVIVRMLLVPASLRLLGSAAWYAPPELGKLYRRLNLRG